MTYLKKFLIAFFSIFIIFLVLRLTIYSTKVRINIYQSEIVVSTSTVKIVGDIFSYKNAVYKIVCYTSKDKKKLIKLFPERVLMLNKGQKTNFEILLMLNKNISYFGKNFYLLVHLVEILPKNVLRNKKLINLNFPRVVEDFVRSETTKTIVEKPIFEDLDKPKETNNELKGKIESIQKKLIVDENKDIITMKEDDKNKLDLVDKKDLIKENYRQIKISTENFLPEYFYNEIIESKAELKNISDSLWNPRIIILLKNNYDVIITSETFNISLKPNETIETKLQLKVLDFITPGEYLVEYFYVLNNKKHMIVSPRFKINDRKPKISLTELPKIKFKSTNTILVEVSDDRGVSSVQFVEVAPKTLKETFYPMTLIAGDRKFGLYSYTTPTIDRKGFYKFYIKVEDIGGNVSNSETYDVQITK